MRRSATVGFPETLASGAFSFGPAPYAVPSSGNASAPSSKPSTPQGEWAYNSYSFRVPTSSELVGKRLVVFLNNFGNGTSSYDNVTLTAVPEPSTLASLAVGGVALVLARVRRIRSARTA
ncbi:MAG: PEP-CTERM sorting domain-containing protein [Isosphaeraceae bacterium]|nr:PEP-CTERM sorting domain-containing protein [Isosphaeraceae bacterium]